MSPMQQPTNVHAALLRALLGLPPTPGPRYRRRPDLDGMVCWEWIATGELCYVPRDFEMNGADATKADAFMALSPDERAAELERRRAEREALPPARPSDPGDSTEQVIERADLGGGLLRRSTAYTWADGVQFVVDAWELADGAAIEIERDSDVPECAAVEVPGIVDPAWRPSGLLALARLLARPEVLAALEVAAQVEAEQDAERAQRKAVK